MSLDIVPRGAGKGPVGTGTTVRASAKQHSEEAGAGDRGEFSGVVAHHYDTSSTGRWIASHLARYRVHVFAFFVLAVSSNIAYSSASVLTGRIVEAMLDPARRLGPLALLLFAVLVFNGLASLSASLCAEYVSKGVHADAREELYLSLLAKGQTFHGRQRTGDIMARATDDTQMLAMMLVPGSNMIVESLLAIVVPCVFITTLHPALLAVPGAFLVCHCFALRTHVRQIGPVMTRQRAEFGALNAGLEEIVSGIEVVKASAREVFERRKYERLARALRDSTIEQGAIEARYLPLLFFAVATGLMFLHSLWLYQRGALGISGIIAAMGLIAVLRLPAFISSFTFSLVQAGLASAARLLGVIRSEAELSQNTSGYAQPLRGEITFENVSFSYGDRPVLSNLSFRIEPGQTVAIVGRTGSGKSTLTQLVNRIYDPSRGRVLIDGTDARDWSLHALRSGIGKIEQDIFLFSRSIADNIAFSRPGITRAEIEQAAKDASAHEFISALPNGYDTTIGQRGATLSGGQRQRIALARAFASDPRILVLDDSTSAIDSATEEEVQRALRRVQAGRTTLLITHRLSMIRWADVILVLERGALSAVGSHEQLLRSSSVYRRIFARYGIELPALEPPPAGALADPTGRGTTGVTPEHGAN